MICVQHLSFGYTPKQKLIEDMSFSVAQGEIFGFLGPSGAGKTTLQKILVGLLPHYGGSVQLAGQQCGRHNADFYEKIGIDFEFSTLYEKLTAAENLRFFASLYRKTPRPAGALLAAVGLQNDADKRVSDYSKGMKARLNFARALLHDPDVLFLDEPTSGLDPTNSSVMKQLILAEKAAGKTIILTTHNMQDAAELCDRVAFIVNGSIRALGTPHELVMSRGAARVSYTYLAAGAEQTDSCPIDALSGDELLQTLIKQNRLLSIHSSEPTLNDIFIDVTGRTLL